MSADLPTRASLLTPQGRGAIATIAVGGQFAIQAVLRYFHPAARTPARSASEGNPARRPSLAAEAGTAADIHSVPPLPRGRIAFGRWGSANGEEVVVCRRGEADVEVHCHGGRAAAAAILADLGAAGCHIERWQQVAAHSLDPVAAEAQIALSQARTLRTAGILLDQYQGALARELDEITALLRRDLSAVVVRLEELQRRGRLGLRLTDPWRVVLAGRPNVGKSSLLNALLGYRRSVVFDQPGTTRDAVRATTAVDGWPIELADTAGLREGGDTLEEEGIAIARRQLRQADLAILVFDISDPWSSADAALLAEYPAALVVHTKCDLPARPHARPAGYPTSAWRGEGLDRLLAATAARLVPQVPPPGAAVPFVQAQLDAISRALHAARNGDIAAAAASIAAVKQPPAAQVL